VERRTVVGVTFLVPTEMEAQGFLVGYSERTGGASEAPFDSLNIGYATGDGSERVRENRDRLMRALGTPPFATAHQTHGAALTRVGKEQAGAGFEGPPPDQPMLRLVEPTLPEELREDLGYSSYPSYSSYSSPASSPGGLPVPAARLPQASFSSRL
jgi:hypothetical protein